ncbi:multidrug efflux system outer membrane protein [Variovorax sp. BK613]|nr:multidrug efflux system outer membrane protein [Variovorax sp. BK613]
MAELFPRQELRQEMRQGEDASRLAWSAYFTDPALRQLIALALDQNRDLRIAAYRAAQARAIFAARRAERLPVIALSAQADRARVPGDLNLTGLPLTGSQFDLGIGVASWEVDLWGRLRGLQDAALETYLASEAGRRAITLNLVSEVANGYLRLREADERLALAHRFTDSRALSLRIFTRRMEEGATSRLNVTQVETLLMQARALGAQLEQSRAAEAHALTLLVGAPVDLAPTTGWPAQGEWVAEPGPGLSSDLLVARPDIVAAEHQLRAENASVSAARAEFFPRIVLTASAGSASSALERLVAAGSTAWAVSSALSLPLFDAGRRQANVDLAQARRQQAVANYEKTVQGAFRDVADAFSARRWADEQAAIAQGALAVQTERARLAQLRYDNGAAAYLEVLDAQRDLMSASQQLVQVRRLAMASRVGLYAALGGGSLSLPAVPEVP